MTWIHQNEAVQDVHIDIKKKILSYDHKKYWIRFESSDLLHIYGYEEEGKEKK